jgi:hypothetical protein
VAVTTRPGEFRFEITQGGHFHLEFPPFLDATTRALFDFTADPEGAWAARLELRALDDPTGDPVAVFATTGEAGVITLSGAGVVALDMAAAATGALTATEEYTSASHGALVGDLVLVDPSDDEPWVWFRGIGQINRQITEG